MQTNKQTTANRKMEILRKTAPTGSLLCSNHNREMNVLIPWLTVAFGTDSPLIIQKNFESNFGSQGLEVKPKIR
jgi:hypothetical protein